MEKGAYRGKHPGLGMRMGCKQKRVEKLWQEEYVQVTSAQSEEGHQGSTAWRTIASSAWGGPGSGETRPSLLDGEGGWEMEPGGENTAHRVHFCLSTPACQARLGCRV